MFGADNQQGTFIKRIFLLIKCPQRLDAKPQSFSKKLGEDIV